MRLVELVGWSVVAAAAVGVVAVVALAVGRVIAMSHRVTRLEAWADSVVYELVAQQQRLEVDLLDRRVQDLAAAVDRVGHATAGKGVA